ncbi:MAG: hypothetical protein HY791_30205 [Deltaproteobacteria bacterium]|nr:hypothetical protein [Deltaproteobacteria bacterium]
MTEHVGWVFDHLPPSGARRGGDPSEHVFKHDLGAFVREVIQNANDQALRNQLRGGTDLAPKVVFRLVELTGDQLESFLSSLSWDGLRAHLDAAAATRGGRSISDALSELDRSRRLLLLTIEDRGTIGLVGEESEGDSHFRALTKDTLFSHKSHESAGGSFGLGKSVLWAFSGLRTVLFNSHLSEPIPRAGGPRLIGRVELPSHHLGRAELSGSGWFGRAVTIRGRGDRAESVWDEAAEALAERLGISRPKEAGTTIGIVGFRDPASDTERSTSELAAALEAAAARSFWPALAGVTGAPLSVEIQTHEGVRVVQPHADPSIEDFLVAAEAARRRLTDDDLVVRDLAFEIPAERGAKSAVPGVVTLAVRLSSDEEDERASDRRGSLVSHVAAFRGSGMVVRYLDKRSLVVAQRRFHAVLIAGTARGSSEDDLRVERFLRAAEPPGHDEWISTPKLKELYKPGYNKALDGLWARLSETLREIVARRPRQGTRGPDALRKRFPIGGREGSASGSPSAFRFHELNACYADGRWIFEGQVEPVVKGDRFEAEIRLSEVGEDGQPIEDIAIERLSELIEESPARRKAKRAITPAVEARIEDGRGRVKVQGVTQLRFIGASTPLPREGRGELALEVTGRVFDLGMGE